MRSWNNLRKITVKLLMLALLSVRKVRWKITIFLAWESALKQAMSESSDEALTSACGCCVWRRCNSNCNLDAKIGNLEISER